MSSSPHNTLKARSAVAVAGAVVLGRFVLSAPAELVEAPAPVSIAPALERLAQIYAEAEALRAQLLAELDAINAALGL